MDIRSIGVEEEVLLVDPVSGRPWAVSDQALRHADTGDHRDVLEAELQREQLETRTRPCSSLGELAAELRRTRRLAATAARAVGAEVAALATSPVPANPSPTPSERYQRMVRRFGTLAEDLLACGCHVHVRVESGEEGVAVLDRIRPWLPVLLALSGNSPFWQGRDTDYASFRSEMWRRWPSAGPPEPFGSLAAYRAAVRGLVDSGTVLDKGMVYFDARLSEKFPTVEVRVCDVCLVPEDVVLLAAVSRALVETAAREWLAGQPPQPVRSELLRLAAWRAARSGLDGELVQPRTGHPVPARVAVRDLIDHVRPALADVGDLDVVDDLLAALLGRGSGASAQREVYRRTGSLSEVVAHAVARTTGLD